MIRVLAGVGRFRNILAYAYITIDLDKVYENLQKAPEQIGEFMRLVQRFVEEQGLAHAGISIFIDAAHAIAHNKVMLIDGATLVTGSFNFTKAAQERNAENLLVLQGDTGLLRRYRENFETHGAHAERHTGR